jgi:hypothetical protein
MLKTLTELAVFTHDSLHLYDRSTYTDKVRLHDSQLQSAVLRLHDDACRTLAVTLLARSSSTSDLPNWLEHTPHAYVPRKETETRVVWSAC